MSSLDDKLLALGIKVEEPDPFSEFDDPSGELGKFGRGNIDLTKRNKFTNQDGSYSTVDSISVGVGNKEVLIPTISDDGKRLSEKQAIEQYKKTGKHLGVFDSVQEANDYAQKLHEQQASYYNNDQEETPYLNALGSKLGSALRFGAGRAVPGVDGSAEPTPPNPGVGDLLRSGAVSIGEFPAKLTKASLGLFSQIGPYIDPYAAAESEPVWQRGRDYMDTQIAQMEKLRPESAKQALASNFMANPGSLPAKFVEGAPDIAVMVSNPELAIPYLMGKTGGETYADTYDKVLKDTGSKEAARTAANKAALFSEASTWLAGKAGGEIQSALLKDVKSKALGALGGAASQTAPFAAQAGAQSLVTDLLTGQEPDLQKAGNAAVETSVTIAPFGAHGGIRGAKAVEMKERFTKLLKEAETGDPDFDKGLAAGVKSADTLDAKDVVAKFAEHPEQLNLFQEREPTVRDLFSGGESSADALEASRTRSRLGDSRSTAYPQLNEPARSQEAQNALESQAVERLRQNNVPNPALAGANDLLSERSIQAEALRRANEEVQSQFPELNDPNLSREDLRAINDHLQARAAEHADSVREERIRQVGEAIDAGKQRAPLPEQRAPEQLQLGGLEQGPAQDLFANQAERPPEGNPFYTQTGRTADFEANRRKAVGDSVMNDLNISRPWMAKPEATPKTKGKGGKPKEKLTREQLAAARAKIDVSYVSQYDASNPPADVHETPESVVEEIRTEGDSTSKHLSDLVDRGRVRIVSSADIPNLPPDAKAFYDPSNGGSVTIIHDRVGKGEVRSLMFHEVGEHAGRDELKPWYEQLFRSVTNKTEADPLAKQAADFGKASADRLLKRAPGTTPAQWLASLKGETLAKYFQLTEQKAKGSKLEGGVAKAKQVLADLYATAKVALVRKGWISPKGDFSPADLRAFARAAIKGWAESEAKPASGPRQYDTKKMDEYDTGKPEELKSPGGIRTEPGAKLRQEAEQIGNSAANKVGGSSKNTFKWEGSVLQSAVRNIFRNSGYPSAQIRKFFEETKGSYDAMQADFVSARNRWEDAADTIPEDLKTKALREGPQVLSNYPEAQKQLTELNKVKRALSVKIYDEMMSNPNLSDKDLAVANKILTNENYLHTSHLLFIPQKGVSNKYVNELLKAYKENPNSEGGKKVQGAIDHIVNKDLAFPDDLTEAKTHQLKRLYTAWTGISAEGKPRSEMLTALEEVKTNVGKHLNDPQKRAYDLVLELLGRGNKNESPYRKIYTGSRMDRTVLTPKTELPEAMHALFGRIDKPDHVLFDTLHQQARVLTSLRYLNGIREMGLKQGWVRKAIDASDGKTTERLTGESFGPLQDMYTTPAVKEHLDKYIESSAKSAYWQTLALKILRAPIRVSKTAVTIYNPGSYAANLIGSPMQLLMNGNLSPTAWAKGIESAAGLVGVSGKKNINPLTRLMIENGLTDSSQIGELQGAESQGRLQELLDLAGYGKGAITLDKMAEAVGKLRNLGKDGYAIMDIWTKFANFHQQMDLLGRVYKAEGKNVSEKDLAKEAAERVKMTNFSYNRAAPWVRALERNGLSMFGPYFYETWRTSVNNAALAWSDGKRAQTLKSPEAKKILLGHSIARAAGQAATHVAQTAMLLAAGGMLAQGGLGAGDDLDKENKIRNALTESQKDQALLELGTKADGKTKVFFNIGRVDPNDPENSTLRNLLAGATDPNKSAGDVAKKLATDMWNQRFMNTFLAKTGKIAFKFALGDSQGKPHLEQSAPELYDELSQRLSGLSPDARDAIITEAETLAPGIITNSLAGKATYDKNKADVWVAALQAGGLKPVEYNPIDTVEKQAKSFNSGVRSKASRDLKRDLFPGMSPEALEKVFVSYKANVAEAAKNFKDKIEGAQASGETIGAINQAVKAAHMKPEDAHRIMRDKLPLEHFTEKKFQDLIADKLAEIGPDKSKAEVKRAYRKLAHDLNVLARKYKDTTIEQAIEE